MRGVLWVGTVLGESHIGDNWIDLPVICDLKSIRYWPTHSCSSSCHLRYGSVHTVLVIGRSSDCGQCGDFGCVFSPGTPGLLVLKVYQIGNDSWQTCVVKSQFRSRHPNFIYTFDDQKGMIRLFFFGQFRVATAKLYTYLTIKKDDQRASFQKQSMYANSTQFYFFNHHPRSPPCRTSVGCPHFSVPFFSSFLRFPPRSAGFLCQSLSRFPFSY